MTQDRLNLADLKAQSPKDLLALAEELEIENASTMRKGDMMFAILKERADEEWVIGGDGVLEVLQDGFGFLRSPRRTTSRPRRHLRLPEMIRQHSLRTGDTVEGVIQEPNENERYFALVSWSASTSRSPSAPATRSPSRTSRPSTPTSASRWRSRPIPPSRTARAGSSTSWPPSERASAA
jgi:transcription termination factor Rho